MILRRKGIPKRNLLSAVNKGRGVGVDSVDGGNSNAGSVHGVGVYQLASFLQGLQVLSSCLNIFVLGDLLPRPRPDKPENHFLSVRFAVIC